MFPAASATAERTDTRSPADNNHRHEYLNVSVVASCSRFRSAALSSLLPPVSECSRRNLNIKRWHFVCIPTWKLLPNLNEDKRRRGCRISCIEFFPHARARSSLRRSFGAMLVARVEECELKSECVRERDKALRLYSFTFFLLFCGRDNGEQWKCSSLGCCAINKLENKSERNASHCIPLSILAFSTDNEYFLPPPRCAALFRSFQFVFSLTVYNLNY